MGITEANTTVSVAESPAPNLDLASGLRDLADWLEAHPELPAAEYASVSFGYGITKDARERLTQLAEALGDRAEESRYQDTVKIAGQFGLMRVHADAKVRALVDAPPEPTEYEPIIPADDETRGWGR